LIPVDAHNALDIGCGEGWLVRELRQRVPHVVGIDPDELCVLAASASSQDDGIDYIHGDFLTHPFEPASFDVITAVASLHHMDEGRALMRMSDLLKPEGSLAVIGLARTRSPANLAFDAAGALLSRAHKRAKGYWETPAPKIWPPPHSYGQLRRLSAAVLPGRQFRRRAMWRYVLTWTKPPKA
jgi:2-polyprenyl-3-methyl-5-hydroxy-6-metoxy-1,4-benzoquinol methylase